MMTTPKIETRFSEVPAADVASFFVGGYTFEEGVSLRDSTFYYDPTKGVFVFKMMVERAAPEGGAK